MRLLTILFLWLLAGMLYGVRSDAYFSKPAIRLSFKDTVTASPQSGTLTTTITVFNAGADTADVRLTFSSSPGWRPMASRSQVLRIGPKASRVYPLSLIKQHQQISSMLSAVRIGIDGQSGPDSNAGVLYVRNTIITRFSLTRSGPDAVYFMADEHTKVLASRLSNQGNLPMRYVVKYSLGEPQVNEAAEIILQPHTDTMLHYRLNMPRAAARRLQNETFQIIVTDDSNHRSSVNYYLTAASATVRENGSDRTTSPLRFEVGLLSRTNSRYVYGNVNGAINLGKSRKINYYYRSEDYSDANVAQKNVFSLSYTSSRLNIYLGRIQQQTDFFTFGNQVSAAVRLGKRGQAAAWYMRPYDNTQYRNYYNNQQQAGGLLGYQLGRLRVEHVYNSMLDSLNHPSAVIVSNRLRLDGLKHISADLAVSAGIDSFSSLSRPGYGQLIGYSFGGNMAVSAGPFSATLGGLKNTLTFPGLYRGAERINAALRWAFSKHFSVSPFYYSNQAINNFGVDTLLNTDRTRINSRRYGVRNTLSMKRQALSLGLGYFEDLRRLDMPRYKYVNLTWSVQQPAAALALVLNSESGFAPDLLEPDRQIWFNSSDLNFTYKNIQLGGNFYRAPTYEMADGNTSALVYTSTMNLIAGYQYSLGDKLTASVNYDIAKYSINSVVTHNLVGNVMYSSRENGISLRVTGSLPLLQTGHDQADYLAGRNFVQVALGKAFNIPTARRKAFCDLKVRLYYDDNGNSQKDRGETAIPNQFIFLNDRLFVTDEDGYARLLNTVPGTFNIDISKVQVKPGMIPADGYSATVVLQTDQVVDFPFRKGKLLTGSVSYVAEHAATPAAELQGIKIIISDSLHVLGYAMTDRAGRFTFNAPAGKYKVSLNPEAFNDRMKPVQLYHQVDLMEPDTAHVEFSIVQKKREMRMIETGKTLSVASSVLPVPASELKKKTQRKKGQAAGHTSVKPAQLASSKVPADSSAGSKATVSAKPRLRDASAMMKMLATDSMQTQELPVDVVPATATPGRSGSAVRRAYRVRKKRYPAPPGFRNCKPYYQSRSNP